MNRNSLRVAAVQMNCELGSKVDNKMKAEQLVEKASNRNAELVVLPELFSTGYRVEERDLELAELIPGETTHWMIDQCVKYKIYLVAAILEMGVSTGLVYDTLVVTGPTGLIGKYRKTHLWDQEKNRFAKGDQLPVFNIGDFILGPQICYEVGFPEGARILTFKGADIIVYPSAFGKSRLYAWDIATRSRALENGTYVIACNRSGVEKEATEFAGHSRIVDPMGNVLAEAERDDEVIVSDLDLSLISEQRRKIPYLRDFNREMISREYGNVY